VIEPRATTSGAKSNRGGTRETRRKRATSTRAALVDAARHLFARHGYHGTGTEEIVARAAVTRGALYHHFAGKEDLFAEVFRVVAAELVIRANESVAAFSGDLWAQVSQALGSYLELVAANEEYRRVLLIDGPSTLGWARWRELQSEFVASGIASALGMLMDEGSVARQPTEPLANLIQAALNDTALEMGHAMQPSDEDGAAARAFQFLLSGLRRAR
jgi:AcrR family transcriptional regulator